MNCLFKLLLVFSIMLINLPDVYAVKNFSVVMSTLDIESAIKNLPKGSTTILIDVDDTIITPASKTFRVEPYNQLIDNIKANKADYPNYQQIVSNWRLKRKVMLLDKNWPSMIRKLKKHFPVYALTKMDAGRFGNITSMEKWRYDELKTLGVEFSENNEINNVGDSKFYRGIFVTGKKSKGQTLDAYKHYLKASLLVLIDDRAEHLADVKAFCDKYSIKFIGLLFNGLKNFKDRPDPAISDFQAKYLIKNAEWLEDSEASQMMKHKKF